MSANSKKNLLMTGGVILVLMLVFYVFGFSGGKSAKESESFMSGDENLQISSEEVAYFGKMRGYFTRPYNDNPYSGIVLIHDSKGLRKEIKTATEQLARNGYMVLAVDLFGNTADTAKEANELMVDFSEQMGIANMRMAVDFLRNQGALKVASLVWSFGGTQSLDLALSGEKLDATVIYYGSLLVNEKELQRLKWPVLGIFGSEDKIVSVESVLDFQKSLQNIGIENEIEILKGVGHSFMDYSNDNFSFKEANDAWEKTLGFLEKNLK